MSTGPSAKDRLGFHGDFWTRFLLLLLRVFPAWFCLLMTWPLAVLFFSLASRQRAALQANLKALHPEFGPFRLWWGGCQVFVQFAFTYMDRLWSLHLGHPVRWEFQDGRHLEKQISTPGGVLLFTAHSGNYDIGATIFARSFPRRLHIVRLPERSQALQQLRSDELKRTESQCPNLRIHYCADEWALGVELCSLLQTGEAVAVQGDRILAETASLEIEHNGIQFAIPRGPLILAQISRTACYPIFLTRLGRCHYRIKSGPPFYNGAPGTPIHQIAGNWLEALYPFIQEHWNQWFVFEPMLRRPTWNDRAQPAASSPVTFTEQCE